MRLYYETKNKACCTKLYKTDKGSYSIIAEQLDGYVTVDANCIPQKTAKEIRRLMADYNNDIITEQTMHEFIIYILQDDNTAIIM